MSKRLIETITSNDKTIIIKIKYDNDYQEYKNEYFEKGIYNEARTNYTDNKQDAIGTAKMEINRFNELSEDIKTENSSIIQVNRCRIFGDFCVIAYTDCLWADGKTRLYNIPPQFKTDYTKYRLLTDDNEVMIYGRLKGDINSMSGDEAFAPLDYFQPLYGCTDMEVFSNNNWIML